MEFALREVATFYDDTDLEGIRFVEDLILARIPLFSIIHNIPRDVMHLIYLGKFIKIDNIEYTLCAGWCDQKCIAGISRYQEYERFHKMNSKVLQIN